MGTRAQELLVQLAHLNPQIVRYKMLVKNQMLSVDVMVRASENQPLHIGNVPSVHWVIKRKSTEPWWGKTVAI